MKYLTILTPLKRKYWRWFKKIIIPLIIVIVGFGGLAIIIASFWLTTETFTESLRVVNGAVATGIQVSSLKFTFRFTTLFNSWKKNFGARRKRNRFCDCICIVFGCFTTVCKWNWGWWIHDV